MEQEQKPKWSIKQKDKLDGCLIVSISSLCPNYEKALMLIRNGANVNEIDNTKNGYTYSSSSPLMHAVSASPSAIDKFTLDQRLSLIRELIDHGADVNLLDHIKENAIFTAFHFTPRNEIIKLLLDAGTNMNQFNVEGKTALFKYFSKLSRGEGLRCVQLMLDKAIQLSRDEKKFLKTWALVSNRLRSEKRGLVKDLERLIAHYVFRSFALDAYERVEKLGWDKIDLLEYKVGRQVDRERGMPNIPEHEPQIDLVEKYLDIKFLEDQVKKQFIQEFKAELIKDSK